MIKTIKVKKQLRLDELIKHIFDNGIEDKTYGVTVFNNTSEVRVSGAGNIKMSGFNNEHTTFTVEVEEEITKYTEFVGIQEIFFNKESKELEVEIHAPLKRKTINDVLEEHYEHTECRQIYALNDKKLQLIWEAE